MMNIVEILQIKFPGTEWVLTGETYADLEWLDASPKPTEKELQALVPQVEYEIAYREIERQRQIAYRDEADPLFFYAERNEGTKQAWLDKIAEIHARLPYPVKP